jgi:hypothetical protein
VREQGVAESLDRRKQSRSLAQTLRRIDAHEHNTGHRASLTKDEITKVLVFSQQQPLRSMTSVSGARGSTSLM